jgi:hypothetical protein
MEAWHILINDGGGPDARRLLEGIIILFQDFANELANELADELRKLLVGMGLPLWLVFAIVSFLLLMILSIVITALSGRDQNSDTPMGDLEETGWYLFIILRWGAIAGTIHLIIKTIIDWVYEKIFELRQRREAERLRQKQIRLAEIERKRAITVTKVVNEKGELVGFAHAHIVKKPRPQGGKLFTSDDGEEKNGGDKQDGINENN